MKPQRTNEVRTVKANAWPALLIVATLALPGVSADASENCEDKVLDAASIVAQGTVTVDCDATVVGFGEAQPGHDVVLQVRGNLTIAGVLATASMSAAETNHGEGTVRGFDGADAADIVLAGSGALKVLPNAGLRAGDGGNGGEAVAYTTSANATPVARGGNGGQGGAVYLIGFRSVDLAGLAVPGSAGVGGIGAAVGPNATAIGGNGGASSPVVSLADHNATVWSASAGGPGGLGFASSGDCDQQNFPWTGCTPAPAEDICGEMPVSLLGVLGAEVPGGGTILVGSGGDAEATGGDGGNGIFNGGEGATASATGCANGGSGGDGADGYWYEDTNACYDNGAGEVCAWKMMDAEDGDEGPQGGSGITTGGSGGDGLLRGGDGGAAESNGGEGGTGGNGGDGEDFSSAFSAMCDDGGDGGNGGRGGKGGDSDATGGDGGDAILALGEPGTSPLGTGSGGAGGAGGQGGSGGDNSPASVSVWGVGYTCSKSGTPGDPGGPGATGSNYHFSGSPGSTGTMQPHEIANYILSFFEDDLAELNCKVNAHCDSNDEPDDEDREINVPCIETTRLQFGNAAGAFAWTNPVACEDSEA